MHDAQDMHTMPQEADVNLTVRIPKALHDELSKSAGPRGMGGLVRRLLEAGLKNEAAPADEKTRMLLAGVSEAARVIEDAYGPWYSHAFTTVQMSQAAAMLARLIGSSAVEPDEPPQPRDGSLIDTWQKLGVIATPNDVGNMIAATSNRGVTDAR